MDYNHQLEMVKLRKQVEQLAASTEKMRSEMSRMRKMMRALIALATDNSKYISVESAKIILGYGDTQMTSMLKRGELQYFQPTKKRTYILRESLDNWIEQGSHDEE